MDIRDVMSFEEFQFRFTLEVEERGVELDIGQAQTVNRDVTAITLKDGGNVRATVYLEDLYGKYMNGQPIEDIVDKVIDTLYYADEHSFEIPTFKESDAKNHLYCVAINKNMNKDILHKVPYQNIEGTDLVLVARYRVGENVSCLVDNSICRDMMLTSDEVLQVATENTIAEGYTFKGMEQVLYELGGITEEEIKEYVGKEYNHQEKKMYVLSNPRALYGAALISSKQVLGEVQDKIKCNFYIIPSSLHEILVIPEKYIDGRAVEHLKLLVEEVNSTLDIRDKLSDNVYYYDARACRLSIADGREKDKVNVVVNTKAAAKGR